MCSDFEANSIFTDTVLVLTFMRMGKVNDG
jgi:hypothetical protein